MKGTTTSQRSRISADVTDGATAPVAAKELRAAAAVVLAAAVLLSGCGTPAPSSPDASRPATSSPDASRPATSSPDASRPATDPGAAASPASSGASAALPDVPVRAASPAPAAPPDPAPRFLTVEGTAISMDIVEASVSPDGAMEIPDAFHQAGWYRHGPAPGAAAGSAVVAGHVDTASDLAPLSQLRDLAPGTRITVDRHGAPPLNYRVRSVDLMAKDKFDGGSLFRRDGPHQLKLVTCGGRWLDDRQDYSDNVIVTAELE